MFIRDLNATILCCTPSYAAYIGETMKEMGLTPDQIPLKGGHFRRGGLERGDAPGHPEHPGYQGL